MNFVTNSIHLNNDYKKQEEFFEIENFSDIDFIGNTIHEEIINYDCKSVIKLLDTSDFDQTYFVNWMNNRNPDTIRVDDICNYYEKQNITIIPGMIYSWFNNDKLCIYDGIHRMLAAYKYNKPMKFLMTVRYTTDEQDIINDFININNSISVPNIYLENTDSNKTKVCQEVSKTLSELYPKFVSSSRKPTGPNFNRDLFTEFLSDMDIDFGKKNIDKYILQELIYCNNKAYDYITEFSIKYPKKCDKYDFWLFYLDKFTLKNTLEKNLKENY